MRFVLANLALAATGGAETYLVTVGEHLQRLGHRVVLYAHELGDFSDHVRDRGLDVVSGPSQLPEECEVVLSQDAVMAYELAERYPEGLRVFRAPSDVYDFELPPQLGGVIDLVVAASERVARCVEACSLETPVLRLRQPIDLLRLSPSAPIRARPRRALMLGNYAVDHRRTLIEDAWGPQGVQVDRVGIGAGERFDVATAMAETDIVVAKGRAALDAMACARAVYVCDHFGTDGWVTADNYALLEADNFGGVATSRVASTAMLGADLAGYHPRMGEVNRDLVVQHHSARRHVIELLAAVSERHPRRPPTAPLRELSRLTALAWSQERLVRGLMAERATLHQRVRRLEREVSSARVPVATRRGARSTLGVRLRKLTHRISSARRAAGPR